MEIARGRESEQVAEDVTEWVEVRSRTRRRVEEGGHEDEGGESCRAVQIFVKVNGSTKFPLDVSMNDKVSDVVRQIPSNVHSRNVYVTCEGKVLRKGDELKSCGVSDGSTVQVVMRGGQGHSKAEKKQVKGQEPVSNKGLAILESDKDKSDPEHRRGRKVSEHRGVCVRRIRHSSGTEDAVLDDLSCRSGLGRTRGK